MRIRLTFLAATAVIGVAAGCSDGSSPNGDAAADGDLALAIDGPARDTAADATTNSDADASCQFVSTSSSKFTSFMAYLDANRGAIPGLSVAIVEDGKLVHVAGVGTRDGTAPVDQDTLFRVGSSTKMFTAVAALSLAQDGLLPLGGASATPGTAISTISPVFQEAMGRQDQITMHHLLTHTSGLPNDSGCALFVCDNLVPLSAIGDWIANYAGCLGGSPAGGPCTTPGMPPYAHDYSNPGFVLAGQLIEAAASAAAQQFVAYRDVISQRVFNKAGMCSATFDPAIAVAGGNYALGSGTWGGDTACNAGQPYALDEVACPARDPTGGAIASAVDMGRFMEALYADVGGAGKLLDPAHIALMQTAHTVREGSGLHKDYGYGLIIGTYRGETVLHHGGSRPGFGSSWMLLPQRGFGVAVLNNYHALPDAVATGAIDCWIFGECP